MTNNGFFPEKTCPFPDNVEKYGTEDRQTGHRQYNTAHAHCMLDN